MNKFYNVTYGIVASTGTYVGKGMSKNLKLAQQEASNNAWNALMVGDSKVNYCSGIAVEWKTITHRNKIIHHYVNY